jgi:hypothetical protein
MSSRAYRMCLVALSMLLPGILCCPTFSQDTPAAAPATRPADPEALSGFWDMMHGPPGAGAGRGPPGAASWNLIADRLQPWARKLVEIRQREMAAGSEPATNANQCLPWALPGNGMPGGPAYSMDIVTGLGQVVFMYQLDHQSHIVYLNQAHPPHLTASYFGHSIGHWESDTLVIDTIGFNDKTQIHDGIPHTGALHVVERLHLNARDQLEAQSTLEDPGAFTAPLIFTETYVRGEPFQEYVCAENNRDAAGAN